MGARMRCPHCEEAFFAASTGGPIQCPACSEVIPPAAATPRAAASAVTSAAGGARSIDLKRSCPACGARYPGNQNRCPDCGESYRAAMAAKTEDVEEGLVPVKAGIRKGVLGGVIMIAFAALWFFVGLSLGRVFFYLAVLAVIGIYAVIKGLATGNLAGQKPGVRRRAR
jgi:hypothetical protein